MYYPDLYGLLLKAFGPATVIAPALVEIAGVQQAFLFGSWAARYLGTPGEDPHDIDLMVVGDPSRTKVARAARSLTERLGREVNVAIVSPERWEAGADGFRFAADPWWNWPSEPRSRKRDPSHGAVARNASGHAEERPTTGGV